MIDLTVAGERDDADLRAMLRENAMPSWVAMSVEREPSLIGGLDHCCQERAVIARAGATPVGMYLCAQHPVHVNGRPATLGYLGGLRVNPAFRHRLRVLREGYASIRALSGAANPDVWYTSVAADNMPARRLLEAGLRGLPRYIALGELVTLALPRARARRLGHWRRARADEVESMCRMHNDAAVRYQLSPLLSPARVAASGANFFVHAPGDGVASCMALWNQQAYKQVVARGYRQPLSAGLQLYNSWARLSRRVVLPRLNERLDQSFLAFFAVPAEDASRMVALVRDALAICPSEVLTLGLHAAHPALPALLRAFRPATYRTIIYAVCFARQPEWDGRPVQPEVAVL